MPSSHKPADFSKGDRVVYRPSKDSNATSTGTISKVFQESPHDKPRFVVADERTKEEKVYGIEHIENRL